MLRFAIPSLFLLLAACPGPAKEVGALSEGSGSGGSEESSGNGSLSASSTSAGSTSQGTSAGTTVAETGDPSGSTTDEPGTETGTKLDIDPGCPCRAEQICTPDGCFGGQVFLNFDGPTMSAGADDAMQDQTSIAELAGELQPHGGDDQERSDLVDAVRARLTEVSLWVTDERPSEGDYVMIVLGDNLAQFGGALEISPLNCAHANPRTVAFVGAYAGDALDLESTASVIAHGIGHTAGLDHVDDDGAIMGPTANPDATFSAGCAPLLGGAGCAAQHADFCGAGQQDSLAELQSIFGAG